MDFVPFTARRPTTMILDLDGLNRLTPRIEPYQHLVMPDFIPRAHQAQVLADFPAIADAGLYTPDEVAVQIGRASCRERV